MWLEKVFAHKYTCGSATEIFPGLGLNEWPEYALLLGNFITNTDKKALKNFPSSANSGEKLSCLWTSFLFVNVIPSSH